jgi:glycosyltransferase domain-containing protein
MIDLSKITIIIMSYNRQHCLEKTIAFYGNTNVRLLILDNSLKPLQENKIPNNAKYLHLNLSFAKRAQLASDLIETPYSIVGADDEIYLPTALAQMQQFLDTNHDYVSVGGCTLSVWEYGPKIAGSWAYPKTFGYHNNLDSALERIQLHTGFGINPKTSFFTCNLTRSQALVECLKLYAQSPIVCTDSISVLIICGSGKSKYLNVLYWIRNWNQSPRSHFGWNRKLSTYEWWNNLDRAQEKILFEEHLLKSYIKFGEPETFTIAWNYIISSEHLLRKNVNYVKQKIRLFNEFRLVKRLKYYFKKVLFISGKLPLADYEVTQMILSDVKVNEHEYRAAVKIVNSLLPYKKWHN